MFFVVIPAGGGGTRLWPLSRAGHPKFLHALTGTPATLLQATADRLAPLAGPEATYVVTGAAHAAAVARQIADLPEENILIEPSPRDSCAAIGLAATIIARHDPDAVMGTFPADHVVRDLNRFTAVVREAISGAERGFLMTVGITPTHPETGYGYLQCGGLVADGPVRRVERFKEKPSRDVAEGYVAAGNYYWNAGMFVWRVGVFLGELMRQCPEMHAGLVRIADAWDTPKRDEVLGDVWPSLEKISVDFAVMEGASDAGIVATVPGDFGWNDIGDFDSLGQELTADEHRNIVVAAGGEKPEVLLRDTTGSLIVPHAERLVAVLGMDDVVVVDTSDVVLVCPRDRAQEVKALVDELKKRGESRFV
jgi:mannose-1-phosphate guanylyltransferase